jgi:hypothetical protein
MSTIVLSFPKPGEAATVHRNATPLTKAATGWLRW